MIILGIDPGLQKTGWGVIHAEGSALKFIDCGLIKTFTNNSLSARLAKIHVELQSVMVKWSPDAAAVEETFVNHNPASALKLGQARGVALTVPAMYGLDVAEYPANLVKKAVTGAGHAAKEQIGMMIRVLLPGCGAVGVDAADALAVAITHAHYGAAGRAKGARAS